MTSRPDPRTGVPEAVERVLTEHAWHPYLMRCACGWVPVIVRNGEDEQGVSYLAQHRKHQAPAVAEALAETSQPTGLGDEGEQDGKNSGVHPDRAGQSAEGSRGTGVHDGPGVLAGSGPASLRRGHVRGLTEQGGAGEPVSPAPRTTVAEALAAQSGDDNELAVLREFWNTFWEVVSTVECACGLSAYEHEDATRLEYAQDKVATFYERTIGTDNPARLAPREADDGLAERVEALHKPRVVRIPYSDNHKVPPKQECAHCHRPYPCPTIDALTQPSATVRGEREGIEDRPHSRACGFREHKHGAGCHSNCPTCGGKAL